MGYVTVLVQHSWALQPSTSRASTPQQHLNTGSEQVPAGLGNIHASSTVRLSIPETVAAFVRECNASSTPSDQQRRRRQALDIFDKLKHLVLAGSVVDPVLKAPTSTKTPAARFPGSESLKLHPHLRLLRQRVDANLGSTEEHVHSSPGRSSALHARRSVLAFTECSLPSIHDRAFEVLFEALDVNQLRTDDTEVESLLKLISDMIQRMLILIPLKNAEDCASTGKSWDVKRISMCMCLAMQRLEFAHEVRGYVIPSETEQIMQQYLDECLPNIQTTDPYLIHLLAEMEDSIRWLLSTTQDKEQPPATATALSFLSQTMRALPGGDSSDVIGPFNAILEDLRGRGARRLGRNYIRFLATAAAISEDACRVFLGVLNKLDARTDWHWLYLGILCLGAIIINGHSSAVGKLVMESLLTYLQYRGTQHRRFDLRDHGAHEQDIDEMIQIGDGGNVTVEVLQPKMVDWHRDIVTEESNAWKIRAGAVVALAEIQRHFRSQPFGILAREAMRARRQHETHPGPGTLLEAALGIPSRPEASKLARTNIRRISYLFRYTCLALAEGYAESHSRIDFLRHYLRSAAGVKSSKQQNGKALTQIAPVYRDCTANARFFRLEPHMPLSTAPYHHNHKCFVELPTNAHKPLYLAPSFLATTDPSLPHPSNGTVNRRKLFHPNVALKQPSQGIQYLPSIAKGTLDTLLHLNLKDDNIEPISKDLSTW
ncbi:uncharacterized protein SPPG_06312 [Spizellomyces punctatus DAOM BR117]|uniref:Uncharacterized protein n=1 Tax=Spizellomyces punctatus (strain DAOM BR117) TaxID=645134 RepID=A0A0L0HAQ1_SPIPD|nr:uncharacterized protein SPPG_06312 [Spizellomyces punctatus DAOM BR117]KNC98630.1 hypothetical protein SPPG_06312 [Spizellomyces punctatus DAOM BR117]|eukprot:XP_016606670.1 hypothetical protein SPPG_06312 [Spizellomyces punctatus DAOM BR117]